MHQNFWCLNGAFHLLNWEGMIFPNPMGKMIDWVTKSSFFPEGRKYPIWKNPHCNKQKIHETNKNADFTWLPGELLVYVHWVCPAWSRCNHILHISQEVLIFYQILNK